MIMSTQNNYKDINLNFQDSSLKIDTQTNQNLIGSNLMNTIQQKIQKQLHCDNCGANGHDYKSCKESICSWGIILVRFYNNDLENKSKIITDLKIYDENQGIKINSPDDLKIISQNMNMIKFLLVRRKHSLGYTEFIRGNYKKDNIDGIIYLFQQMTPDEIRNISVKSFDELWEEFWGSDTRKKNFNKKQYLESKENFDSLKNKIGVELSLDFYVNNVKPFYSVAEYGLPKGRKQRGETDIECAIREFCEETGYSQQDIKIIRNVKPIIENMVGTNGVSYRFIYYLAEDLSDNVPKISERNSNEIGAIGFYTYDETLQLLREYHIEKRNIIKNVFIYYLNNLIKNMNNMELIEDDTNKYQEKMDTINDSIKNKIIDSTFIQNHLNQLNNYIDPNNRINSSAHSDNENRKNFFSTEIDEF